MKIAILASDGSSIGCTHKTIWGQDGRIGCGGSELAIMTLAEEWTKKGHRCILFNSPIDVGVSPFEQRSVGAFDPSEYYDVVIAFRTPNQKVLDSNSQLKVFLSFDQFTSKPFTPFISKVDKVVGISQYHSDHFKSVYDFHDMIVIDLPLRVNDFDGIKVEKIQNRLIYASVPDRGIWNIQAMWPEIKRQIPDATIRITSDYRLWGKSYPGNEKYFIKFLGMDGVIFPANAALPRKEYLNELCKAEVLFYPHQAVNPELFCISMAEAQFASAYPLSSDVGALRTTNMGTTVSDKLHEKDWHVKCINELVELLSNRDELIKKQNDVHKKALERFHPDTVLDQWEKKVFI